MSQAGSLNESSGPSPPDVPIDFVTDAGTAIASLNVINIFGGTNITTSATGNTITINANTTGFKVATTNVGFAGGTSWFPVFATPLSSFTPAQVVPFGEDTATALAQSPQLSSLGDAVQNVGFLGMVLGGGGNGTALTTPIVGPAGSGTTSDEGVLSAPDTLYWLAGKSTYGGL